jgi:YaiO family outer membrane protein
MISRSLFGLCIILLLSMAAGTLQAQDTSGMSVDELFERARTFAFDGQTKKARVLLKVALDRAPDYIDIRLFMGRTYAWDHDFDKARTQFDQILNKHPKHQQTWEALAQIELWDRRYEKVLQVTDQALKYYPEDALLLATKTEALVAMDRFDEAQHVKDRLAAVDPNYDKLPALQQAILNGSRQNIVSWSSHGDFFSDYYDSGYETSLQYERKESWGSVIGRVNLARRFDQTAPQFEVDAYPKVTPKMYAYLNYGYSGSELYPQHRIGAELFRSTSKGWEYSAGVRYLRFTDVEDVTVLTASLSAYIGNWWISARPFFSPFSDPKSGSVALMSRRYLGSNGDYLGAEFVIGASYGERLVQLSNNTLNQQVYLLDNRKLAVDWLHYWNHQFSTKLRAEVGQQELSFNPDSYVGIYSLLAAFYYRF